MLRVIVLAMMSVGLFVGGAVLWGVAEEATSAKLVVVAIGAWLGAILCGFDSLIAGLSLRKKRADLPAARVLK